MRIIIAEDSEQARLILQSAVESLGHACRATEDGAAALELFQRIGADVVISDWLMPRMDGLELVHQIRGLELPHRPYFIFLTQVGDREHMLEAMQAGADDYLIKPLDPNELELRLIAAERLIAVNRAAEQTTWTELNVTELNVPAIVKQLEEFGPRFSTTVILNNRPLLLDSVIKLVEQLPMDARLGRRGHRLEVTPDPFSGAPELVERLADEELASRLAVRRDGPDIVASLRQQATTAQYVDEDAQYSWWRRLWVAARRSA